MSLASNLRNVLLIVIVVLVIYGIYRYFSSAEYHLSRLAPGTKDMLIPAPDLPTNKGATNYAYSIWFFVNDWGVNLETEKALLVRGNQPPNFDTAITLAPYENNIIVRTTTYPSGAGQSATGNVSSCKIKNFPLQKWVNLTVSLNGRTLDLYLDGKLVRTCVLPGVVKVNADSPLHITPSGGFSGWTSNLRYYTHGLNPQEAYNIYKEGPGTSGIFDFFEKYKVKVSYLVDDIEKGSLTF